MIFEIVRLHRRALPHTLSSRMGERLVASLYFVVNMLGYVKTVRREGRVVGVISGVGRWILTLVVDPEWQRQGIGRELLSGLRGRRYVYTEVCTVGFYEKLGFSQILHMGKVTFLWRK